MNILGNFFSHRFCVRAATVAARNGVPDHLIQALSRWLSSAYQLYMRTPSDLLAATLHQTSVRVFSQTPAPPPCTCPCVAEALCFCPSYPPPLSGLVVESWESHVTQKPRGTERVVLLDTFRCIVCLYIKVLLEFLWIIRPRLLIIAPAIRLQVVESLN